MARTTDPRATRGAAVCALLIALGSAFAAPAQDVDCRQCHQALEAKKVVHGALGAGCTVCHAALDASTVPHKLSGEFPKGLAADLPALCVNCHDAGMFEGKFVHAPVAADRCNLCHDPHASDHPRLLVKQPVALCLDCHEQIGRGAHVLAGIGGKGHPVGTGGRPVEDPLRPGNVFYCASCHQPHRSEFASLTRFESRPGHDFCTRCHLK